MLYGITITGSDPKQRRTALDAALDLLRKELIVANDAATAKFFAQGKLVLLVRPSHPGVSLPTPVNDDDISANNFRRQATS